MTGILNHAFQIQQTGYWCGPAAVRVALSARGVVPSQQELAIKLGTTVNGTDSSNDVVRVLNQYLGAGIYEATFIPGQDATAAQRDEFRRDVHQSIDNGYAIVANVVGTIRPNDGGSYTYSGGHYVAIVGYDGSDNVFVADIAAREYWVSVAAMATWIAARGYASSTVSAPAPPSPAGPPPWPSWVPAGEYFGLITGPAASHGGINDLEKAAVLLIQRRLQELGYAPGGSGWADGLYEQATADAVAAFQRARLPGTTRFGEVWPDDWAALFGPVPEPPPPPPPPDSPPVVVGDTFLVVDLASPYQDGADLAAFKAAGVQAVNIKTSEGVGYVNPQAIAWGVQARANELGISTFHWLDSSGTGAAQARKAFEVMTAIGAGTTDGMAHVCDCEDDAPLQTITEYLQEMQQLLGRPVAFYSGDWWMQTPQRAGWNIAALTPYLWAAPNAGYLDAYPGDDSPHWTANYGGYSTLAAMQFAVGPLPGAPGNVSKTQMRKAVWAALIQAPAPAPPPEPVPPDLAGIADAVVAALAPLLLTKADAAAVVRGELDKTRLAG